MAGREKIRVEKGSYLYQEVIQLKEESTTRGEAPIAGGYNFTVVDRPFDEWYRILEDSASANDTSVLDEAGVLFCIFTGAMLYPILRVADAGKIAAEPYLTLYVHEDLGIKYP